ncbi:MAG TPA: TetR/AcrR family transcriptional regulator [Clostridia bacterium]|nr:TetR/AcrR family transcriptional regulator [Clostridia bacterium]
MYDTFENLPESKKEHIIQVCIEEFAKNGYKNTSTNTIVKRLGISKGVLFLYFKSKKNLFIYIVDYLTECLTNDFFKRYSDSKQIEFIDIFDQMGDFYNVLLQDNPYVIVFILEAVLNTPSELREEILSKHDLAHERLLEKMKMNNLRKDIDTQLVLDLMHMASYHIGQKMLKEYGGEMDFFKKNTDEYIKLFNQYVDIIKYGVYRR